MALRILLADDHPVVSAAVADRLHTQTGWEICGTVTSATALLNSVATLRPDVVVTDYHMPSQQEGSGDGLRMLAALRRRHPSLAVTVLTMITNPLVLRSILDTPISPELLPPGKGGEIAQRSEDLVGPYELHDFFLYWFLRFGFGPRRIAPMALHAFDGRYDLATIRRWLRLFLERFFANQFKRDCAPDSPKVGSGGSLSPRGDWRMP